MTYHMTKIIIISGLMIIISFVVVFVWDNTFERPYDSLLDFIAGIVFGAGIILFAKALSERRSKI